MAARPEWVAVCRPLDPNNSLITINVPRSGQVSCSAPDGSVSGVLVLTKAYVSDQPTNWEELANITPSEAHVIGATVGVVWAIAWSFRAIRLALLDRYSDSGD